MQWSLHAHAPNASSFWSSRATLFRGTDYAACGGVGLRIGMEVLANAWGNSDSQQLPVRQGGSVQEVL